MTQQVKLKVKDGYFGCFQLDNDDTLVAPIINLSAAKALIAIPKKKLKAVQAGDSVALSQIVGATNISFNDRILAKIDWIKDLDHSPYLAAACNFYNLADASHNQISCFVKTERATRGQYD